jgi:hypothetical protein
MASAAVYSYVASFWSKTADEKASAPEDGTEDSSHDRKSSPQISSGAATPTIQNGDKPHADERTSLLENENKPVEDEDIDIDIDIDIDMDIDKGIDVLHALPEEPPSVKDFYFTPNNPTVQRYYRFSATPITPIVALHKKPGTGNSAIITSGVTGLLRRSAVVPSHGTDTSGGWILVSVGGRSGWARKKMPEQHFSGFTLARSFAATEGWMGNHAFLCNGKVMLGSDAPSLFFTNVLLLVGYILHFLIVLPRLRIIEEAHPTALLFLTTDTIFWFGWKCV